MIEEFIVLLRCSFLEQYKKKSQEAALFSDEKINYKVKLVRCILVP